MPEMYQAKILVLFRDADSVERIPALGENLHVPAPEVVPDQPGGIGLADIAHLLEPQGKSETLSFLEGSNTPSVEGTGRTINFKIEPKCEFQVVSSRRVLSVSRCNRSTYYTSI
jgi:hypothetical protein